MWSMWLQSYKEKGTSRDIKCQYIKGIKYQCDECDYKATLKENLKKHKMSVHIGFKYPCDQCDYKATQKGDLKKHRLSVHIGIKYQCDQCDYKAT